MTPPNQLCPNCGKPAHAMLCIDTAAVRAELRSMFHRAVKMPDGECIDYLDFCEELDHTRARCKTLERLFREARMQLWRKNNVLKPDWDAETERMLAE